MKTTNFFDLTPEQVNDFNDETTFHYNSHWVLYKVNDTEYEAIYDGLYMHIFGSLEDLLSRQNEIDYFEYSAKLSEERQEETFVNSKGQTRN